MRGGVSLPDALHHPAMGGTWGLFGRCDGTHYYYRPSSYGCAFAEGLADYGGFVGASDDPRWEDRFRDLETLDCSNIGSEYQCEKPGTKPKIEAFVAALFNDMIDAPTQGIAGFRHLEPEDKTHYGSRYVMHVFATCEVKYRKRFRPDWEDRNDVADFVWCLENRVDTSVHEPVFPGIKTPHDVREKAIEPWDWNADSIRSTWLLNLK